MNDYMESMWSNFLKYHKTNGSSQRTIDEYSKAWKQFTEWLILTPQEISADTIDDFLLDMREGWQPPSRIARKFVLKPKGNGITG